MQRALVVTDFPILACSVVRQLGANFLAETQTWNEFLESGETPYGDLLVIDVTTVGEQVALDLVHAACRPLRLAMASLHTNQVRMFHSHGPEMHDDGWLPTLLALTS